MDLWYQIERSRQGLFFEFGSKDFIAEELLDHGLRGISSRYQPIALSLAHGAPVKADLPGEPVVFCDLERRGECRCDEAVHVSLLGR